MFVLASHLDSCDVFFCEYQYVHSTKSFVPIQEWDKAISDVHLLQSAKKTKASADTADVSSVRHPTPKISVRLPSATSNSSSPMPKSIKLTLHRPHSPRMKSVSSSPDKHAKPRISLKITPPQVQKVTIKLPKSVPCASKTPPSHGSPQSEQSFKLNARTAELPTPASTNSNSDGSVSNDVDGELHSPNSAIQTCLTQHNRNDRYRRN
jgi:hypothetical protein